MHKRKIMLNGASQPKYLQRTTVRDQNKFHRFTFANKELEYEVGQDYKRSRSVVGSGTEQCNLAMTKFQQPITNG